MFLGFWIFVFVLIFVEFLVEKPKLAHSKKHHLRVNFGFGLINSLMASSLPLSIVLSANWALNQGIGLFNWIHLPIQLTIIGTVLFYSLSQYLFHRMVHSIPVFWSFHKVHHTDLSYGLSTGFRFHPFELVANIIFVSTISIAFGFDVSTMLIYESLLLFFNMVLHTSLPIPKPLDQAFRILLITPTLHRIHHSNDKQEYDSNFGIDFSFWDRLFNTYLSQPTREQSEDYFGIKNYETRFANSLDEQLRLPIRDWFGQTNSKTKGR
ncbi:MAG: hypothetical protein GKR95_25805 [Gammaproteobacteria bacterium]|nr:hypothetical protein [Gammaproteobacteria bacterium]